MLLLVDLSVRRRRLYEGLFDAMVLFRMYAALVDLVKVLFLMVVFLGWVINVSLSTHAGDRKSDPANHTNHGFIKGSFGCKSVRLNLN